jgi:hypothetical protein
MVIAGCTRFARVDVDADPAVHGDGGRHPVHAGDVIDMYETRGEIAFNAMVLAEKRTGNDLKFTLGIVQR